MEINERWATGAAALPQANRNARERPFWAAVTERWRWRRVADAGCGSGFHLALLRDLGVDVFGFDLVLATLPHAPRGAVAAGDVLAPPLRPGAFDAVLCLGNTISLLPDRAGQRRAVAGLAALLRPGGVLLLQGEDAARNVAAGPCVRTRRIDADTVHVRVFERRGRRVRMLAGVVPVAGEASLGETLLLPTDAASVTRVARAIGLRVGVLPTRPPGGGASWWLALARTGDGTPHQRTNGKWGEAP